MAKVVPRRSKKRLRGPIFRKNGQNFGFFGLNRDPGGAEGRLRSLFFKKWPKSGKKRISREMGTFPKNGTFPDCKLREKWQKWPFFGPGDPFGRGSPGPQTRSRGPQPRAGPGVQKWPNLAIFWPRRPFRDPFWTPGEPSTNTFLGVGRGVLVGSLGQVATPRGSLRWGHR